MSCHSPRRGFRAIAAGEGDFKRSQLVFTERQAERLGLEIIGPMDVPCGRCRGCLAMRASDWAARCVCESKLHAANCVLTLTYDDAHLPHRGMLVLRDLQLFMKRLRKAVGKVRFYAAGEYGDVSWRPHFHLVLFGYDFPDKVHYTGEGDRRLWTSQLLADLWGKGHCTVGVVHPGSAEYVARYCLKKQSATKDYRRRDAEGEYQLPREFNVMSRRPGVGISFLSAYQTDVYPNDYLVRPGGSKTRPPRAFDKRLAQVDPAMLLELQVQREAAGISKAGDNTPERLAVKEQVLAARQAQSRRSL